MTTTISGDTGVSQVQAGAIGPNDFTAGAIKASDLAGGTGSGNLTQYTTAVTPLPAAGSHLIATHGLGVVPVDVVLEITCLTAEHGYSVGDVIQMHIWWNGSSATPLHNIWKNSTYVGALTPNTHTFFILNRATNAPATPTAANWSYRFRMRAA